MQTGDNDRRKRDLERGAFWAIARLRPFEALKIMFHAYGWLLGIFGGIGLAVSGAIIWPNSLLVVLASSYLRPDMSGWPGSNTQLQDKKKRTLVSTG